MKTFISDIFTTVALALALWMFTPSTQAETVDFNWQISVQNQEITINAGDTVRWSTDGLPHTITGTSGPESWNSGTLSPNSQFARTFPLPGIYQYACSIHPSMTGSLTVVAPPAEITGVTYIASESRLDLTVSNLYPNTSYHVEFSTNLTSFIDLASSEFTDTDDDGTETVLITIDKVTNPKAFYRIVVGE